MITFTVIIITKISKDFNKTKTPKVFSFRGYIYLENLFAIEDAA
jgi:hypothetical protein